MSATKAEIVLEEIREALDERDRIINVIKLEPSDNDNLQLRQLLDRFVALVPSDVAKYNKLASEFNGVVDDICTRGALDVRHYRLEPKQEEKKEVRFDLPPPSPPSPPMGMQPFEPYRDEPEVDNHAMFAQHQQTMLEQDSSLDVLHQLIKRQHQMGTAIGEELDNHVILLDDLERGVDDGGFQLERAQRRLDHFRRQAQQNGLLVTIVVLTVILITLLVVLN